MIDSLLNFTISTGTLNFQSLISSLILSLLLGLIICWSYRKGHQSGTPSNNFSLTLILLPAVVAAIIILVGTNIASAFSLAGAFSIIRFRSAPGDPKDILYVLLTMAVGLASGMGFLAYAVIIALLLSSIMLILQISPLSKERDQAKLLKITIPENVDYETAFKDIMEKYTSRHSLMRVATTDLGSLYELVYEVSCKTSINEKEFIDELRCKNSNLRIMLLSKATTATDHF